MISDIFTFTDPHDTFKGQLHNIFSSLVSMSNKDHYCETRKKKFYFTFKAQSNFKFSDIHVIDAIECLSMKYKTHFIE